MSVKWVAIERIGNNGGSILTSASSGEQKEGKGKYMIERRVGSEGGNRDGKGVYLTSALLC